MEKEIKYKGKTITIVKPSGMFEYYSDKQKRFLKFDDLGNAKASIDKEKSINEAPKKKITLNEVKALVKQLVKETSDPKSWGVGSFGVTHDVDLSKLPFEDLESKTKEILIKRIEELSTSLNVSYSGNGHFEKTVLFHILKRKTKGNINIVTDEIIKDSILDVEEYYDY
jgi:hypothetical protein